MLRHACIRKNTFSNKEAKQNNDAHQEKIANAILKGIHQYFAKNPPQAKNGMI